MAKYIVCVQCMYLYLINLNMANAPEKNWGKLSQYALQIIDFTLNMPHEILGPVAPPPPHHIISGVPPPPPPGGHLRPVFFPHSRISINILVSLDVRYPGGYFPYVHIFIYTDSNPTIRNQNTSHTYLSPVFMSTGKMYTSPDFRFISYPLMFMLCSL